MKYDGERTECVQHALRYMQARWTSVVFEHPFNVVTDSIVSLDAILVPTPCVFEAETVDRRDDDMKIAKARARSDFSIIRRLRAVRPYVFGVVRL